MEHENPSTGNDDYPFVDTLDKMAKFANQNRADKTVITERNGGQADISPTAHDEPYRQHELYGRQEPSRPAAHRPQTHFSNGDTRRGEGRFPDGDTRRREGRSPSGDTRQREGHFSDGDTRRGEGRFPDVDTRRREGRFPDGDTRRGEGRFPDGDTRQREGRSPSGDPRRGEGHFSDGDTRQREGRSPSGDTRQREGRSPSGDTRRGEGHFSDGDTRRREGRFPDGDTRRREGRFPDGDTRQREGRSSSGDTRRSEGRFPDGDPRQREGRFPDGDTRRADTSQKNSSVEEPAAAISAAERTEKNKSKKYPVALLCLIGAAVLTVTGIWTVMGHHSRSQGVLPDGKSVKYAAVSPSDGENGDSATSGETTVTKAPPSSDRSFVRVTDYAPDIRVDLKYAGRRNFTGKRIYHFEDAYLRYGTVKKLIKAQKTLKKNGMGLMIWDAYRPHAAQKKLWEVCPNPLYVKDPDKGYSDHTRGSAVDVTLVDSDGTELLMPTEFDNFTKLADRDYSDIDNDFARDNVRLLEKTMKACGFKAYSEEWWHFTDSVSYEVEKDFVPES